MLKKGLLTNKERNDLICLTNIKVAINKMIKVCCIAVVGKLYLIKQNKFNKWYCSFISKHNLK
jgi:hypothetical protein